MVNELAFDSWVSLNSEREDPKSDAGNSIFDFFQCVSTSNLDSFFQWITKLAVYGNVNHVVVGPGFADGDNVFRERDQEVLLFLLGGFDLFVALHIQR